MKKIVICFWFLLHNFLSIAQATFNPNKKLLPLDSSLKMGTLKNGFKYYVKQTESNNVSIYLVVKAGNLQEGNDQLGLAHVLEHVALKGTKRFPKDVFSYTDKMGMKAGEDINAFTSFYSTVYMMLVSDTNAEAIEFAVQLCRDIASEALLRPEDIEIERHAVLAEMVRNEGLIQRNADYILPKLLGESVHSRKGFGKIRNDNVRVFTHDKLIKFYKDWYRPDLQSVIVTGNVKADEIVNLINKSFGQIPKRINSRPYINHSVFKPSANRVILFTDTEQTETVVQIYQKLKPQKLESIVDLRKHIIAELYNEMIDARFREIMRRRMPPFKTAAHAYKKRGINGFEGVDILYTAIKIDSIINLESQLKNVLSEIFRIEKFGFKLSELVLAKEKLCSKKENVEQSQLEYVSALQDNFLHGYPVIDRKQMPKLTKLLLDSLTLKDVNQMAKSWIKEDPIDIVINANDKLKSELPDKKLLSSFIANSRRIRSDYLSEERKITYDLATPVYKESMEAVSYVKGSSVTEVGLSNGIKLILKRIADKSGLGGNSEVSIHCFSNKGASMYKGSDYWAALAAGQFIGKGGVGNLDYYTLNLFFQSEKINVAPYIENFNTGIRAKTTVTKLGVVMSMIYQYFTNPVKSRQAFDNWRAITSHFVENQNIEERFMDTIRRLTFEGSLPFNRSVIDCIDWTRSYEIFKELFNNAGDFTLVVVGDFSEMEILPVLKKFIGSLPGASHDTLLQTSPMSFLPKHSSDKVMKGCLNGSLVELRMLSTLNMSKSNIANLQILNEIVESRLMNRLREKEKGVYAVTNYPKYYKSPSNNFLYSISFKCADDKTENLLVAAIDEIRSISNGDISPDEFDNSLKIFARKKLNSLSSNDYWVNHLFFNSYFNLDLEDECLINFKKNYIDLDTVRELARTHLDPDNCMKFLLIK